MGTIRKFIKNDAPKPPRHGGHDLAQNVRDATGPASGAEGAGGGSAGRAASEAVLQQTAQGKQRPSTQ